METSLTAWIKSIDTEGRDTELKFTLPQTNLEALLKKTYGETPITVSKLSEQLGYFNVSNSTDLLVLNEVLKYIERVGNDDDKVCEELWDAFLAISNATGQEPVEAFATFTNPNAYEFFPNIHEMSDLASYMVQVGRVFTVKVPFEVRPFLDYNKIGNSLTKSGNFYTTKAGILWLNAEDDEEPQKEAQ